MDAPVGWEEDVWVAETAHADVRGRPTPDAADLAYLVENVTRIGPSVEEECAVGELVREGVQGVTSESCAG